jgi:hypothetical protein
LRKTELCNAHLAHQRSYGNTGKAIAKRSCRDLHEYEIARFLAYVMRDVMVIVLYDMIVLARRMCGPFILMYVILLIRYSAIPTKKSVVRSTVDGLDVVN